MRDVPPPLSVTVPPPSITVSFAVEICDVTVIVTGAAPQLKTTVPPPATAVRSAASVQLAAEPSPTVVVGADVSTSGIDAHVACGIAASTAASDFVVVELSSPHAINATNAT